MSLFMWAVKLIFIVACIAIVTESASNDDDVRYMPGIVYDQAPSAFNVDGWSAGEARGGRGFDGTDFEIPMGTYTNSERGLVGARCTRSNYPNCGRLSVGDQTPIYAFNNNKSPGNNIKSADTFYNWFHLTTQTRTHNISIPLQRERSSNLFTYRNDNFFPVDGKGWKDKATNNHNYAFCMVSRARFVYEGGEKFDFYGDDDVWVYINGYLVIDLGALHQKEQADVELDDLSFMGLEIGKRYNIDFFYCERHTTASNFKATTSIALECERRDRCGECEGTGQSCCTAQDLLDCDDGNQCTIEYCGINEKCSNVRTEKKCSDDTKCSNFRCDPARGCVEVPRDCTGGSKCHVATCSLDRGCSDLRPKCDDNKICTTDTCNSNTGDCTFTNQRCSPTACQIATHDGEGCCKYADKCTSDDPCVRALCSTNGTCYTEPVCQDRDACNTATCTKTTRSPFYTCGVTNVNTVCNRQSDRCTTVSCDINTGSCRNDTIPCTPLNACFTAACDPRTGCKRDTPRDCSAFTLNKCFIGKCNNGTGCFTERLVCNDNNPCTIDSCNNATGCIHDPKEEDNNECTIDSCNRSTGTVTHTNRTCDDSNSCTLNQCDPTRPGGCVFPPKNCDDSDLCTTDSCDSRTANGCVNAPIPDCERCTNSSGQPCTPPRGDRCFPAVCQGNICTNSTVVCDDDNKCTVDFCKDGQCDSNPLDCSLPVEDKCVIISCNRTEGCQYTPKNCNDNKPCTIDSCLNGVCSNILDPLCVPCGGNACNWTDPCKPKICNALSQCVETDFNCDDGDLCTDELRCEARAGQAVCVRADHVCQYNDTCNPSVCHPTQGCQPEPVACNPSHPCELASCNNATSPVGTCQYVPKSCETDNPCIPKICNRTTGECEDAPVVCPEDDDPCTDNVCVVSSFGTAACVAKQIDCGTDECGAKVCNSTSGLCETAFFVCNDYNNCTDDAYICDGTTGYCSFTPTNSFCDDSNPCTQDYCDPSNTTEPCTHIATPCSPRNMCETVALECDNTTGCVFEPVFCPGQDDVCKVTSCDPRSGCRVDDKYCPVRDTGCFNPVCDSSMPDGEQCKEERKSNWGSRTSTNGVLCALRYDATVRNAAIGTGAAVGIAIGAAAGAGLIGYGGKKGYDHWKAMQNQRFEGVQNNPLYAPNPESADNPLYNGRNSVQL